MEITDLVPKALLSRLEEEQKSLVYYNDGWTIIPNNTIILLGGVGDTINFKLDMILQKLEGEGNGCTRIAEEPSD